MLYASWLVMVEMAPWLFIGALLAGVIMAVLPANITAKMKGATGVFWALLVGLPLPLCSCGVIPVAVGLKRQGASAAAVATFLVVTPQTGVDSFFVTAGLLGWKFAWLKAGIAVVVGLVTGLVVAAVAPYAVTQKSQTIETEGRTAILLHGFQILRSIRWWVLGGALISGVTLTLTKHYWLPGEFLNPGVALLVSVPVYVCATASVPIAATMVSAGFSSASALVFLVAGPATNLSTLGVMGKELGKRAAVAFVVTLSACSLVLAYVINPKLEVNRLVAMDHASVFGGVVAASLCMLLLAPLPKRNTKVDRAIAFSVGGMTCGGCVRRIEISLASLAAEVKVDLKAGTLHVSSDADPKAVEEKVVSLGFTCAKS